METRVNRRAAIRIPPLLCICWLAGCVVSGPEIGDALIVGEQRSPVIYGSDSRRDFYQVTDRAVASLAQRSIVALIRPESLAESNPSNIRPRGPSYGERFYLCEDESFFDQVSAATCSGTLIGEDLVLTAGHCIDPEALECETMRIVFNFRMVSGRDLAPIRGDDVYRCQEVVTRNFEGLPNDGDETYFDHAILRLDRPVSSAHRVAPVSLDPVGPTRGDALTMIGFGNGLPMKIDQGGSVTDSYGPDVGLFLGTPDAFGGNSGSGVFNSAGEVVGILSFGPDVSYVDTGRGCYATNHLSESSVDASGIVHPHGAVAEACAGSAAGSVFCPPEAPPMTEVPPAPDSPPDAWTCPPSSFAAGDGCDCGCGVVDPDCMTSTQVHGCGPDQTCSPTGECVDAPCANPDPNDPENCLEPPSEMREDLAMPVRGGGMRGTWSCSLGSAGEASAPTGSALWVLLACAARLRRRGRQQSLP